MNEIVRGISFPFRVSVQGGATMSVANDSEITHIIEQMQQVLKTPKFERGMEYHIYSEVDSLTWEANNPSTAVIAKYYIKDCLTRCAPLIEVEDIEIINDDNVLLGIIGFSVKATKKKHVVTLEVGLINDSK